MYSSGEESFSDMWIYKKTTYNVFLVQTKYIFNFGVTDEDIKDIIILSLGVLIFKCSAVSLKNKQMYHTYGWNKWKKICFSFSVLIYISNGRGVNWPYFKRISFFKTNNIHTNVQTFWKSLKNIILQTLVVCFTIRRCLVLSCDLPDVGEKKWRNNCCTVCFFLQFHYSFSVISFIIFIFL